MTDSFIGTRPDAERAAIYEAAWNDEGQRHPAMSQLLKVANDPKVTDFIKSQFLAACYLEDCLRDLHAPEHYRKEWCFKFGQLCFGRREVWPLFDKVIERCEADMAQLTKRAEWAEVPIEQNVPELSELAKGWWEHARSSVGEEGVFPQPYFVKTHDDKMVIVALAVDGNTGYKHIVESFRRPDLCTKEAIFGIDMSAMPGQGIEFDDFLAVVWYFEGEFYTGVVNYQCVKEGLDDPAFREIDWNNNYWNHSQREHPIAEIKKAIEDRNVAIRKAEEYGSPPFDDLPFEQLSPQDTARLIELMPRHLQGLLVQWGWGDTVLRDSLFGWLLQTYWDLGPHDYYKKDDDGRFVFEPLRNLIEDKIRIPLDLSKLEPKR